MSLAADGHVRARACRWLARGACAQLPNAQPVGYVVASLRVALLMLFFFFIKKNWWLCYVLAAPPVNQLRLQGTAPGYIILSMSTIHIW